MFPTVFRPIAPIPRRTFSFVVTLCFLIACSALSAPTARAADFVVTTLNDSEGDACGADCSLRQAINAGNGGVTNITFAVTGTIRLLRALPDLEGTMTISNTQGTGVTISGDANNSGGPDSGDTRIFTVARDAKVTLDRLTISNGFDKYNGGGVYNNGLLTITNSTLKGNRAGSGGAIYNSSRGGLTLTNSVLTDNSSDSGGGIDNEGGTATITNCLISANSAKYNGGGLRNYRFILGSPTMMISDCTMVNNSAEYGGGLYSSGDKVTVINSTFASNSATKDGGGIYNSSAVNIGNTTLSGNSAGSAGGGIYNSGTTTLANSTLSSNSANTGGGILSNSRNETGTSVINSIVSGNNGPGGTAGTDIEFTRSTNSFASGGYNLIGNGNAIARFAQAGDQTGVTNPRLGPLQDNGGPTQTRALLDGSPAINGGDPSVAFDRNSFDQRGSGFFRVRAGRIDIGAFELEIGEVPIPPINAVDDSYTLTFGNAGQSQQAGVTLLSTGVFLINTRGVLANDSDPSGGALTAALASYPSHGRLQVRSDGSVYYLPSSGFVGADAFTYTVSNGQTASQATVRLNIVDRRAPELRIDTPPNGITVKAVPAIKGRVRDKQSGVKSVTLLWQRFDGAYWNGSAWTASEVQLPLVVQGINWAYNGSLPAPGTDRARSLLDGSYELTATATDNSGNVTPMTNRIVVKNETAPTASNVRLSSVGASAALGFVVLNFTGALDAASAGNVANYRVGVNNVAVRIGTATYANNSVTLGGFNLSAGDKVTLQIGDLRDASGKTIAGGTIQLVAR